jgi:phosphate-selective porin OprO/OprP
MLIPWRNSSALILVVLWSGSICAQSDPPETPQQDNDQRQKIDELEKKVDALAAKLRDAEGDKPEKGGTSVSFGTGGVAIRSNDGNLQLRIGLDLQIDGRFYPDGANAPGTDGFLIRRARPTISGTVFKYVDFYVRPDFGLGQAILYDSYIDFKYFSRFVVRAGKFKPPVGLERLQSDDDTNFIERGLPTLLVPSRDIGYQISGDVVKRRVNYAVGVFNGVADNSISDAGTSSHKDYAARVVLTPFQSASQKEATNPLSGLGLGMAATGGAVDGLPLPAYKTLGQVTFFHFNSGVSSAGHRTRLAPQAYYYLGPFGLLAEFTRAEEGFQKGSFREPIAFRAWQVEAAYILTGEKKGFNSPVPKKNFDPLHHDGWGALELSLRMGDFAAERGVFNYGFADIAKTPRRAHEWLGAVSWYPNRNVRISFNAGNTNFAGGATGGNRPPEKTLLSRFQVDF